MNKIFIVILVIALLSIFLASTNIIDFNIVKVSSIHAVGDNDNACDRCGVSCHLGEGKIGICSLEKVCIPIDQYAGKRCCYSKDCPLKYGCNTTGWCVFVSGAPFLPQSYIDGYITYETIIGKAVEDKKLTDAIGDKYKAKALVAAIISQESGWKTDAHRIEYGVCKPPPYDQSDEHSYGLMQVIPCFHPECDPKLKENTQEGITENIYCGTGYLKDGVNKCRTIEGAIANYNSNSCNPDDTVPNYVPRVMGYYYLWLEYILVNEKPA